LGGGGEVRQKKWVEVIQKEDVWQSKKWMEVNYKKLEVRQKNGWLEFGRIRDG
jgi:hypothetical protein